MVGGSQKKQFRVQRAGFGLGLRFTRWQGLQGLVFVDGVEASTASTLALAITASGQRVGRMAKDGAYSPR